MGMDADEASGDTHIYVDESGFTGQDLLNRHQPVFCIASTTLDVATTDRYHAELLEGSNAHEIKHTRLVQRPRGRMKVARFLQQVTEADDNAFAVWACHKQFALLTYFVDLWCEPLALQRGVDLYKDGAALAMSNMTYFVLPAYTNDTFLDSILRDFQTMMMSRSKQSYDRLLANLKLKYNSSEPRVQEVLVPFLGSIDLLGYRHLQGLPDIPMDLAEAGLVRLCHSWRNLSEGPFVLYHDQSTQLARNQGIWKLLLSEHMPPKEIGSGERRAIYPVNVREAFFVRSLSEKRIQLCDVVAGAVATWGRGLIRGETSDYLEILRQIDLQSLVKAMIWPEFEVDPDKLGTRGYSSEGLDYITRELAKRMS